MGFFNQIPWMKDFGMLSRTEQIGYWVLGMVCLIVYLTLFVFQFFIKDEGFDESFIVYNIDQESPDKFMKREPVAINYATVSQLQECGFSSPAIVNLFKYRERGGVIKNIQMLNRIYGVDSLHTAHLVAILDYGVRSNFNSPPSREPKSLLDRPIHLFYSDAAVLTELGVSLKKVDTLQYYRKTHIVKGFAAVDSLIDMDMEEFIEFILSRSVKKNYPATGTSMVAMQPDAQENVVVGINQVDSAYLENLTGIGGILANRIIEYRKKLGGFVSLNQLLEVSGVTPPIVAQNADFLKIDTLGIVQLDLNLSSISQLTRHPYISFYLAKEIVEFRKAKKKFKTLQQIKGLPSFDDANPNLIYYFKISEPLGEN